MLLTREMVKTRGKIRTDLLNGNKLKTTLRLILAAFCCTIRTTSTQTRRWSTIIMRWQTDLTATSKRKIRIVQMEKSKTSKSIELTLGTITPTSNNSISSRLRTTKLLTLEIIFLHSKWSIRREPMGTSCKWEEENRWSRWVLTRKLMKRLTDSLKCANYALMLNVMRPSFRVVMLQRAFPVLADVPYVLFVAFNTMTSWSCIDSETLWKKSMFLGIPTYI